MKKIDQKNLSAIFSDQMKINQKRKENSEQSIGPVMPIWPLGMDHLSGKMNNKITNKKLVQPNKKIAEVKDDLGKLKTIEELKIKKLFSMKVGNGIFLILSSAADEKIVSEISESKPEAAASTSQIYFNTIESAGAVFIYVAYVEIEDIESRSSMFKLALADGDFLLLNIEYIDVNCLTEKIIESIIRKFGKALLPAFKEVLNEEHKILKVAKALKLKLEDDDKLNSYDSSDVKHFFEGIYYNEAHGWIYNSKKQDKRYEVDIYDENGLKVGSGVANKFRGDLFDAGFGDGCYHFKIRISSKIYDGSEHGLCARVKDSDEMIDGGVVRAVFENKIKIVSELPLDYAKAALCKLLAKVKNKYIDVGVDEGLINDIVDDADFLQKTGFCAKAINKYKSLEDLIGVNDICKIKIAECWAEDKNFNMALIKYKMAVEINKYNFWGLMAIGDYYWHIGKFETSLSYYREAAKIMKDKKIIVKKINAVKERINSDFEAKKKVIGELGKLI
jgi:tetratricopeptide (TPR) repeat protein